VSGKIIYINSDQWENEVLNGKKVVVDFYSTECLPCEALAAKFEPLSEIYGDDIKFVKIFRQENRELAVSLGVESSPTILFYDSGKRTGDILRGGIKRRDLLQNLDTMLPDKRVKQIQLKIKPEKTETDLLILGAGPAGLAAAIYSAQAKVDTLVVDRAMPGGQVSITHLVSNYPSFIKPVEGFMLMHQMSEQAKSAGAKFRSAVDITSLDLKNKKIVIDDIETVSFKKIIIATGSSPRLLNIPGESEYKGRGLSYCATCDAKYYHDMEVIIIGGGNTAIEEALFISKFASKITIVHQFAELQANKQAQGKAFTDPKINFIFEHEPREFIKNIDGSMTVTIENLKTKQLQEISARGVFIFVGMKPNLDLFNGELERDQWGYIKVDKDMRTNIHDVFAAGDVAEKQHRQITLAVADGTVASLNAIREL
jgi:thioredoxin reductase (NADPH)